LKEKDQKLEEQVKMRLNFEMKINKIHNSNRVVRVDLETKISECEELKAVNSS
jgi:hypothetical protein